MVSPFPFTSLLQFISGLGMVTELTSRPAVLYCSFILQYLWLKCRERPLPANSSSASTDFPRQWKEWKWFYLYCTWPAARALLYGLARQLHPIPQYGSFLSYLSNNWVFKSFPSSSLFFIDYSGQHRCFCSCPATEKSSAVLRIFAAGYCLDDTFTAAEKQKILRKAIPTSCSILHWFYFMLFLFCSNSRHLSILLQ